MIQNLILWKFTYVPEYMKKSEIHVTPVILRQPQKLFAAPHFATEPAIIISKFAIRSASKAWAHRAPWALPTHYVRAGLAEMNY